MSRSELLEGMWAGDLEDLVLPLASFDQFNSKIDKRSIVIGFYVNDRDAANDLNRFVQKSPIPLLDTDVSPAPDQDGFYYVFVEMMFNEKFGENVDVLLKEISPLARIEKWRMKVRNNDAADFSPEIVQKQIKTERDLDITKARKKRAEDLRARAAKKHEDLQESVLGFLRGSDLEGAKVAGERLFLESRNDQTSFGIIGFDNDTASTAAIGLSTHDLYLGERVRRMLGSQWQVFLSEGRLMLQSIHGGRVLVLTAQ